MRDDLTYIVTQKVTANENVNKSISRERIIGQSEKILNSNVSYFNFCDAWYALCRGVHGRYTP